jgi:hypothetical protein
MVKTAVPGCGRRRARSFHFEDVAERNMFQVDFLSVALITGYYIASYKLHATVMIVLLVKLMLHTWKCLNSYVLTPCCWN